jgi:hypothetical protein
MSKSPEDRWGCRGARIRLQGGRWFDLANPVSSSIHWHDVAVSLAKECRFTNQLQLDVHYSVAEHSVLCYRQALCIEPDATAETLLYVLTHDASEAYTGDVSSPLKQLLGVEFKTIEDRIQRACWESLGLDPYPLNPVRDLIKRVDRSLYALERKQLFPQDLDVLEEVAEAEATHPMICIRQQQPEVAFEVFRHTFVNLCCAFAKERREQFGKDIR